MKGLKWVALTGFALLLCQGCATPNMALKVNTQSISSLEVARTKPPSLVEKTVGAQAVAFTGIFFGAIGGAVGGAISEGMEIAAGKALAKKCALPDFSGLVLEDFAGCIQKDLPAWPKPVVLQKTVGRHYKGKGYTVVLNVVGMEANVAGGLETYTIAKMTDPRGKVVWKKGLSTNRATTRIC